MKSRTESHTFADDEPVGAFLQQCRDDGAWLPAGEVWMPERLAARLSYLGHAYELPLLARLPWNAAQDDWSYPGVQLPALADELLFLRATVADEALHGVIEGLCGLLGRVQGRPDERLLVSPP